MEIGCMLLVLAMIQEIENSIQNCKQNVMIPIINSGNIWLEKTFFQKLEKFTLIKQNLQQKPRKTNI